jgi:spermidine synthase
LTFTSGAAALAHQLLWTRRLIDIVGASADSFSRVIGAFFVGLALGAWLASRREFRPSRFWKGVCYAELAVAVLAALPLFGRALHESMHSHLAAGVWFKWLLPVVLITPAATAMGCVMPWTLRALGAEQWFQSRHAIVLYAVNMAGGISGLALVVAFGLPQLGLNSAAVLTIAMNVALAIGALALNGYASSEAVSPEISTTSAGADLSIRWLAIASAASGFLVLASEVIVQHQLSQVAINSLFSSAMVLGIVLTSLTLAAFITPLLSGRSQWSVPAALGGTALLCAVQPLLINAMHPGLELLPYELPPGGYAWELVKLGAVAAGPMFLVGGLVFPLLLRAALDSGADGHRVAGILLACNGFGGWLGAELGQSWLAPRFGLWLTLAVIGAGYGILYASSPIRGRRPALKGLVLLGLLEPSRWRAPRRMKGWLPRKWAAKALLRP